MKWTNFSLLSISWSSFFLLFLISSEFNLVQADKNKNSTSGSKSKSSLLPAFNILVENFEFDEIQNCLPEFIQHYSLNKPAKKAVDGFLKILEDEPQVDKVLQYLSLSSQSGTGNRVFKSMKEVTQYFHVQIDKLTTQYFDPKLREGTRTGQRDEAGLYYVTWKILSFISFQDLRQDIRDLVERDVGFSNFLSFLNNEEMADAYHRIKSSSQVQEVVKIFNLQDGFAFDLHYDILGFLEEIIGWDSYWFFEPDPVEESSRVVPLPEIPAESEPLTDDLNSKDGGDIDDLHVFDYFDQWISEPSAFDDMASDDESAEVINQFLLFFRSSLSKMAGVLIKNLGLETYEEVIQGNIAIWTDSFIAKIIGKEPISTMLDKYKLLHNLIKGLGEEEKDESEDDVDEKTKQSMMSSLRYLQSEAASTIILDEMKEMLLDELIRIRGNTKKLSRILEIIGEFHTYIGENFPWSKLTTQKDDPRVLSVLITLVHDLEKQFLLRQEFYQLAEEIPDSFGILKERSGRTLEMGVAYHRELLLSKIELLGKEFLAHKNTTKTKENKILFQDGLERLMNVVDGMKAEVENNDEDDDDQVKPHKKYRYKSKK